MTDHDQRLEGFRRAWHAGLNPSAEELLTETPADAREPLRLAIERFLQTQSGSACSGAALPHSEVSPAVQNADRAMAGHSGAWPLLLPALRRQACLARAAVAAELAARLGHPDAHHRVHEHLHAMESGTLDARGVADEVVGELARILGLPASDLAQAGAAPTLRVLEDDPQALRRGFDRPPPFSEIPDGYAPARPVPDRWAAIDALFISSHP